MGMDTYRPSQSYGRHPIIWSLFIYLFLWKSILSKRKSLNMEYGVVVFDAF